MPTQTLWLSPIDFVTGDSTLKLSFPSVKHPAVEVKSKKPGDLKWVYMGLRLPPCSAIKAVRICYQLENSRSFISQVRLTEMQTPEQALVRHDDPIDFLGTVADYFISILCS